VTAVAHFPGSLDKGPLERFRRPLAVVASLLLVVDLIGLGLHLADAVGSPFANDRPARAKATVGGPDAVVPGSAVLGSLSGRQTGASRPRSAEPYGCLALNSGCYAGPPAPTPGTTPPGGSTTTPPNTPPKPVPVVQADVAVPALGTQVSLGVGDGGCTAIDLTLIALGNCPAATGDGPVILHLGGSLLGGG
jgi:hypothetical protein